MENTEKKWIALWVPGGGYCRCDLLSRRHDVTLFEKNDYVGGHTNTIAIHNESGAVIPVDTGFIVLNDRTYPLFNRFLSQLGVAIGKTEMSFSYMDGNSNLQYARRISAAFSLSAPIYFRCPSGGCSMAFCDLIA